MSNKRLIQNRGVLFEPSVKRDSNFVADVNFNNYLYKSNEDLIYESKRGKSLSENSSPESKTGKIYSTNEYNIDFSKFENHTFFDSAVSKTSIAFDSIINLYPFDGSRQDIENFRNNSTGFETHVFDNFPNSRGYLIFRSDGSTNQHIAVKDLQGYLYSSENSKKSNEPVFSPNRKGFTTEFWVRVPPHSNNKQVICQLIDPNRSGFSISLDSESSTTESSLHYTLISGSRSETLSLTIDKGKFVHLAATYDNKEKVSKIFVNGKKKFTSNILDFDMLEMRQADFLIGSGSSYSKDESTNYVPEATFSGSIDEIRYYHGCKTHKQINRSLRSSVYKGDEENIDLNIYLKFNEPQGNYSGNNLVLDYSGNSLHSVIANYDSRMRMTGSHDPLPLTQEIPKKSPILFPDHPEVKSFNSKLLTSASNYDTFNPNLITKLIPVHYLLEGQSMEGSANLTGSLASVISGGNLPNTGKIGSSQLIISFLLVWAKFFDELKISIDNFSKILSLSYEEHEGTSAPFYRMAAEHKGIKLPQIINRDVDYLKFAEGLNLSSLNSLSKLSLNQVQNEIWKRLLLNVNQIHKEKGTKRSIKTLFNSFGLEFGKYFELKEYGGPRAHYLSDLRKFDKKVVRYIDFSGSAAARSPLDKIDVDSHGFSAGTTGRKAAPYLVSPFLTASRVEAGFPEIGGTFVNKDHHPPHGISNDKNDGLLTSGSFTYEGVYKFTDNVSHHKTQSLVRLATTGSSMPANTSGLLLSNLIAINDSKNTKLKLYVRHFASSDTDDVLETQIVSASIFDGNPWYISFGKVRNDDTNFYDTDSIKNTPSSSYFLRCGRIGEKKARTYLTTSSFYMPGSNSLFNERSDTLNSSGSFLIIGSQSITTNATRGLNPTDIVDEARHTEFSGKVNFIRFYSRALTDREARERVKNPFSLGVKNPINNFNHNTELTGAFNRSRLDATISRQLTTGSDNNSNIRFFDNSQNGFHLSGKMFEPDKKIIKSDQINLSRLSYDFDERVSEDRVRVRSYQLKNNLEESLYARQAPVHEIQEGDKADDDKRLSIDLSSVRSLNEDIVKMLESLEVFDEMLGDPRSLFEEEYLEVEKLREVYFQELLQKIDLESHVRFFTWFDNSFTDLIKTLIPLEAVFLGVNYVIESHILERNRVKYYFNQQYLDLDNNIVQEGTTDSASTEEFGN